MKIIKEIYPKGLRAVKSWMDSCYYYYYCRYTREKIVFTKLKPRHDNHHLYQKNELCTKNGKIVTTVGHHRTKMHQLPWQKSVRPTGKMILLEDLARRSHAQWCHQHMMTFVLKPRDESPLRMESLSSLNSTNGKIIRNV